MTYDLRMALAECVSVMGEHIDPDADYPREVLARARQFLDSGAFPIWQPVTDAPLNVLLILWDREHGKLIESTISSEIRRNLWIVDGFYWWTLSPLLPKGEPA